MNGKIAGFFVIPMGSFLVGINVAILFPNPGYHASWEKICIAAGFVVFCGIVLYKSLNERDKQ